MSALTARQERALELLSKPVMVETYKRDGTGRQQKLVYRDLYQSASLDRYGITYTGGIRDVPTLSTHEAKALIAAEGLVPTYPDVPNIESWQVPAAREAA